MYRNLITNVMVFGGGLWEVMRSEGHSPHEWDQCPNKGHSREIVALPSCEDTEKTAIYEPGSGPSPDTTPVMPGPPRLQNQKKYISVVYKPPICGVLF